MGWILRIQLGALRKWIWYFFRSFYKPRIEEKKKPSWEPYYSWLKEREIDHILFNRSHANKNTLMIHTLLSIPTTRFICSITNSSAWEMSSRRTWSKSDLCPLTKSMTSRTTLFFTYYTSKLLHKWHFWNALQGETKRRKQRERRPTDTNFKEIS